MLILGDKVTLNKFITKVTLGDLCSLQKMALVMYQSGRIKIIILFVCIIVVYAGDITLSRDTEEFTHADYSS